MKAVGWTNSSKPNPDMGPPISSRSLRELRHLSAGRPLVRPQEDVSVSSSCGLSAAQQNQLGRSMTGHSDAGTVPQLAVLQSEHGPSLNEQVTPETSRAASSPSSSKNAQFGTRFGAVVDDPSTKASSKTTEKPTVWSLRDTTCDEDPVRPFQRTGSPLITSAAPSVRATTADLSAELGSQWVLSEPNAQQRHLTPFVATNQSTRLHSDHSCLNTSLDLLRPPARARILSAAESGARHMTTSQQSLCHRLEQSTLYWLTICGVPYASWEDMKFAIELETGLMEYWLLLSNGQIIIAYSTRAAMTLCFWLLSTQALPCQGSNLQIIRGIPPKCPSAEQAAAKVNRQRLASLKFFDATSTNRLLPHPTKASHHPTLLAFVKNVRYPTWQ